MAQEINDYQSAGRMLDRSQKKNVFVLDLESPLKGEIGDESHNIAEYSTQHVTQGICATS